MLKLSERPKFGKRLKFSKVILSNVKCGLCSYKNCTVRYYPERQKEYWAGGTRYLDKCKKDIEKEFDKAFGRK